MAGDKTDSRRVSDSINAETNDLSPFEASGAKWLQKLLSRRLVFVTGKGGVGKTTISIALAFLAEQRKQKVLLVELGDTDAIGRLFHKQALTQTPCQLSKRIWGARVNAKDELKAYVQAHVSPKFIAAKIIRSRLFEYLFEAAPGLKEVMSLGRLWRWENDDVQAADSDVSVLSRTDPDGGNSKGNPPPEQKNVFDLIIIDAPATGHALSLLRLPDVLINMIRVGPLAGQVRELQRLLKDDQKTSLVIVSLPEELPANETIELYSLAKKILQMPISATFVNCVYPIAFSGKERQRLEELKGRLNNNFFLPENLLIASAQSADRRQANQQKYVKRINETADADNHVLSIPFQFTNDLKLKEIHELSVYIHNASIITPEEQS